jgi:hypothetical protein
MKKQKQMKYYYPTNMLKPSNLKSYFIVFYYMQFLFSEIFRTCEFEKNFQHTISTFMKSCNEIENTNVAQRSTTENNPIGHNKLVEKQKLEDYHIFLPTLLQYYKDNCATGVDKLRIAAHWVF